MSAVATTLPAAGLRVSTPVAGSASRVLRWTKEELLIHGEIWEKEPMNTPHAVGLTRTRRYLARTFSGIDVRVRAPIEVATDSLPHPDFAVVPLTPDDDLAAFPDRVSAGLVVEIADTSLDGELTVKAERYATAGVPDNWVLDVVNRALYILHDPGTVAGNGTAYRTQQLGPDVAVSPLAAPNRAVKVADLLP